MVVIPQLPRQLPGIAPSAMTPLVYCRPPKAHSLRRVCAQLYACLYHAYVGFRTGVPGGRIICYLKNAWAEDPYPTLRITWRTLSVHDSKADNKPFCRYVSPHLSEVLFVHRFLFVPSREKS